MFYAFTRKFTIKSPIVPPMFKKKGYHVASLSNVVKWMAEKCEALGVEIYPGFSAKEVLTDGDRVIGVRTGDMGVDKDGKPKPTYQAGMDILAKVTVFGEGVRGNCTKQLIQDFGLEGQNPDTLRNRNQGNLARQTRKAPARPRHSRIAISGLLQ